MKSSALCVLVLLANSLVMAQVAVYSGRTLKRTVLMTVGNQGSLAAQASCNDAPGCSATAPLFPVRNVTCPVLAGKTCTFTMQAETPVFLLDTGNLATLSCQVPGAIGPQILANNIISFAESGPASFTFLAQVKNSSNNQSHSVECEIGCLDAAQVGSCSVYAGSRQQYMLGATVRIDVFTP